MIICYIKTIRQCRNNSIANYEEETIMICPQCGSNQILTQTATSTTTDTKTKGFGWIKACLGYVLFSVPGILCGLCGMGKGKSKTTTTTKLIHICQTCGKHF